MGTFQSTRPTIHPWSDHKWIRMDWVPFDTWKGGKNTHICVTCEDDAPKPGCDLDHANFTKVFHRHGAYATKIGRKYPHVDLEIIKNMAKVWKFEALCIAPTSKGPWKPSFSQSTCQADCNDLRCWELWSDPPKTGWPENAGPLEQEIPNLETHQTHNFHEFTNKKTFLRSECLCLFMAI